MATMNYRRSFLLQGACTAAGLAAARAWPSRPNTHHEARLSAVASIGRRRKPMPATCASLCGVSALTTCRRERSSHARPSRHVGESAGARPGAHYRAEEHTSELQSLAYLVCRLLLEKKKKKLRYEMFS